MLFLRVLSLVSLFTANARASSHWIVTETGLIQSKKESPFQLAKPYDLIAFLNQETRWQNTHNIYNDILLRLKIINSLWAELEEQANITSHMAENDHCKAAGEIQKINWYASIVEEGKSIGISDQQFKLYAIEEFRSSEVPDCKKISSLIFSMTAFEHLEGMINREHLNATPETNLPQIFSPLRTVDQYGYWLSEVLRKNTTSWLHYNLAAIYWRIKGNAPKALECSRRAVHYSPRHYKTIALLCMGSILHRSKRIEDAIIVLRASVDHAPTLSLTHFSLGKAYAVAGYFNDSLSHFNMSMTLKKGLEQDTRFQRAVMCHRDMSTKMQYAQRTMMKLKAEIKEYKQIELEWFKVHAAFLKTMLHKKEYDHRSIEKNCVKMEEMTQLKIKALEMDRSRVSRIQYLVSDPQYTKDWLNGKGVFALADGFDLEKLVKRIVEQSGPLNTDLMGYSGQGERNNIEILKEIGPKPTFPEIPGLPDPIDFPEEFQADSETNAESGISPEMLEVSSSETLMKMTFPKQEDGKVLYPSNLKVNRQKQDFDTDPDWPSNEFCQEAKSDFPDTIDAIYPVFMPFEHKGVSLESLLTDMIGLSPLHEHELPWHPPLCPNDKDASVYASKKPTKVQIVPKEAATEYLRFKLYMYVSYEHQNFIQNMQEAEIGQRIQTAMERKLAPKWVLYTLASLYWRVRSNNMNALNCLLAAQRFVDDKYKEIVLVSLGSVFLEMGLWVDALINADEAYRNNPYEPPTNFLLAQIHLVKKHQKTQFLHLKQVLRVDPHYLRNRARALLNCWACIAKQVNTLKNLGVLSADIDGDKDICAETEAGVSMVCDRDGTNCRLQNKHCTPGNSKESSTLVHMLEEDDETEYPEQFSNSVLESTFDKVINSRPTKRQDRAGHLKNYELMMRPIKDQMAWCKSHDCGLSSEAFNLNRKECAFNMFETDYWLLFVSFQMELGEAELKMVTELVSITPSHKRIPECRVTLDASSDFFLTRILAVDTEGWGGLFALVQQLADLFSHDDFGILGAKLAKYVETNAHNWWGALAAGWWCGAVGRGGCAVKCLAVAHALAPPNMAHVPLRPLIALLHLQNKNKDAADIAYLSFYIAPNSKTEGFLVGLSHHYNQEIDDAIWMYRYALSLDYTYVPATACLHRALCLIAFGKDIVKKQHQTPT